MPMRIYALAKDLKIDSKELVDLCTKAGITGKGSALASLEDDEIVKLKTFLAGPVKKLAPKGAAEPVSQAPVRPSSEPSVFTKSEYVPPSGASGKIRVLDDRPKRAVEATATAPIAAAAESTEVESIESTEGPAATVVESVAAAVPVASAMPAVPIVAPMSRAGIRIGVMPTGGLRKFTGDSAAGSGGGSSEPPRPPGPPKKREPVIKLAAGFVIQP